jgi:beta-galactosidase
MRAHISRRRSLRYSEEPDVADHRAATQCHPHKKYENEPTAQVPTSAIQSKSSKTNPPMMCQQVPSQSKIAKRTHQVKLTRMPNFPARLIGLLSLLAVVSGCASLRPNSNNAPSSPRGDRNISAGWRFMLREVGGGGQGGALDDSTWQRVDLPHTWNGKDGQDGGDNYYRGAGWYRRTLEVKPADAGRQFFLRFEGASTVADVYVNGEHVGQHRGAFGAFCYDVTELLRVGPNNLIAVRVDNTLRDDVTPISGDFTISGGLYRDVHLLVRDPLGISPLDDATSGVYLKPTRIDPASATVQVTAKVRNADKVPALVDVVCVVRDHKGKPVDVKTTQKRLPGYTTTDAVLDLNVVRPHFWDGVRDPYLYRVDVEVRVGPRTADAVTLPLGLRTFHTDPNEGFFLNGRRYDVHGVNKHQDRADKGWAINRAEQEQDVAIMRELGCTGVRLAHYQHPDYTYELCDKAGLVVWAELAYINATGTMPAFGENAKRQLRELIKQNYNHPSVCFWSLYNELRFGPDQSEPKHEQLGLVEELNRLAHELDPSRPTVGASNMRITHPINWLTDLTSFNRYHGWYRGSLSDWATDLDEMHNSFLHRAVAMSEFGGGASIHHHDVTLTTRPVAGGPWHPEEWQCAIHEAAWKAMSERPWLWGKFLWVMFDFASDRRGEGDTMGINDKGLVTRDRKIRKDAFYFYQANWSDRPVLHVTSKRYNPRPAGPTHVKVYSNCDQVELFLNGASVGTRSGDTGVYIWNLTLPPGKQRVTTFGNKNGKRHKDEVIWNATTAPITTQPTPR